MTHNLKARSYNCFAGAADIFAKIPLRGRKLPSRALCMILVYAYLIGYLEQSAAVHWTKAYILELPCYSAMLNWGEGVLSVVVAHPKNFSRAVSGNWREYGT